MDETATPTVSEPDIADECDIRVAEHICEPGRIGISIPKCAFPENATPYLGDDTSCEGTLVGDKLEFLSGKGTIAIRAN